MRVAVIGFGVAALSVAWACHKRGWTVSVHYKKRVGNSTQAAGGMLSPSCEADGCSPELIELARHSCQRYPHWIGTLESSSLTDCEYSDSGTFLVALHHDHHQELTHLTAFQKQLGLRSEWISRKELKRRAPNLTRHVGGLYFADDHHINPRSLHQTLLRALQRAGVQFYHGSPSLDHNDTTAVGLTDGAQRHQADAYIIADGAWAQEHLNIPLRPVKGQYMILKPKGNLEPLIEQVIRTPDVYLIPRADGSIYVGATMEEEGWNTEHTAGAALDFLYHAFQVLPGVYEMNIDEHGCGFRPALRDNQPLIGPTNLSNVFCNIGHYRHGILIAPAAAEMCVDSIAHPETIPTAFSWSRFHRSS